MTRLIPLAALFPILAIPASCSAASTGDKPPVPNSAAPFAIEELARFEEPWAMAWADGTETLFVTEKKGALKFLVPSGEIGTVSGVPKVAYGGQGGLGDIAFAPGQQGTPLSGRTLYLSWAQAGGNGTRGAVVGKGTLTCESSLSCTIEGLEVIWRQEPAVTGQGHYGHRIAFSPDGQHLFVSSGDRQKLDPAQDTANTLGTIVRLLPDGSPAPDNPLADQPAPANQIWSWGHRNILGLAFDDDGQLWSIEHGPAGGDELNRITPGINYGWPLVSQGKHYDGKPIPDNETRPEFTPPALDWTPVIAPGGMIHYSGSLFPQWQGQLLIAAMKPAGLVSVELDGETAREAARYPTQNRIRAVSQGPDGAVYLLEDGRNLAQSRLLRLTPSTK